MRIKVISAWLVHLVTALGAVVGLFALHSIAQQEYVTAFRLMFVALLIDGVDGSFARRFNVDMVLPRIDGVMLDNLIDYLNYVFVPAFFVLETALVPVEYRALIAAALLIVSAYQFSQVDAKTPDLYFKGFPSYWNIVVFYLFLLKLSPFANLMILTGLIVAVFVPIKYLYPSRLEFFSTKVWKRRIVLALTIVWACICVLMLYQLPALNPHLLYGSLGYVVLYLLLSLYSTFFKRA